MDRVIFACVENAGRSQMAQAFFNQLADPAKARAISAGTQPAKAVHPVVVSVMKETGLDVSREQPKRLTTELAAGARYLITMGCGDACPYLPGAEVRDWDLEDPKGMPLERVRDLRDDIHRRVREFVHANQWGRAASAH